MRLQQHPEYPVNPGRVASSYDASKQHDAAHTVRSCLPPPEVLNHFFRKHSHSFSFAARWFSDEEYHLVTRVYAFCRTTDDLVDESSEAATLVETRLDAWQTLAWQAYHGQASGVSWLDDIMNASAQANVPFRLIADLIEGVRMDLGRVVLPTMAALHLYTHRVASVVGIWLCYLFEAQEAETFQRAAVMGRAMQVTNIVRDVGEDLRYQRVYLPADLREHYGVSIEDLFAMASGATPITNAYKSLLEALMEQAEVDYRYAFEGLAALPTSFARASAVAAEVYQGIHRAIRRNSYDNFSRRAYTRLPEKVLLAARALYRLKRARHRPRLTRKDMQENTVNHSKSLFSSDDLDLLKTPR